MKKILILIMYCNDKFFIEQEKFIRNLWVKDILDKKYQNIDIYSYTSSNDNNYHIDTKNHRLFIPSDDGLYGTAEKTIKCFKLIEKLNIKYDYILRTNTSTYINIPLLNAFIQEIYNEKIIYGGQIYCAWNFSRPYRLSFIIQGNAMILSKYNINLIINKDNIENAYKQLEIANKLTNKNYNMNLQDDSYISAIINSYYINKKENHTKYYNSFSWCPDYDENLSNNIIISYRKHYCDEEFDKQMRYEDYDRCMNIHNKLKYNTNLFYIYEKLYYNDICILEKALDFNYMYYKYGIEYLKNNSDIPYIKSDE